MICPKCGADQDPAPECIRCGVIFGKIRDKPGAVPRAGALRASRPRRSRLPWTRILQGALLAAAVLFVLSWFQKDRFPGPEAVLPELLPPPDQAPGETDPFSVEAGGVAYTVSPLFTYEIRGMVVSHHDCGAWWDIYHRDRWKDFLNVKDLCLVWGGNLQTGVYRDMRFRNDSWTCSYFWPDAGVRARFREDQLSNNHLLCADDTLRRTILETGRGDQVRIRGSLASYAHGGTFHRGTSTRRDDTGNGACETLFVEEYEILRRANPGWRALHTASGFAVLGCVLLLAARFVRSLARPGRP